MTDAEKAKAEAEAAEKAKAEAEAKAAELVECRVLCDCDLGRINDVVKLPRAQAEAMQGGDVDMTPSAVKAAKAAQKAAAKKAK